MIYTISLHFYLYIFSSVYIEEKSLKSKSKIPFFLPGVIGVEPKLASGGIRASVKIRTDNVDITQVILFTYLNFS